MQLQKQTSEPTLLIDDYLRRLDKELQPVPAAERTRLVDQVRARIDLEAELCGAAAREPSTLARVIESLGEPSSLAAKLRQDLPAPVQEALPGARLTTCRDCKREVSRQALTCPHCGAGRPGLARFQHGYEWKSERTFLGRPLVHVAWGVDENGKKRVARGFVAIGQYGVGAITIAQFGVGTIFGLGQFVLAPISIGQFAVGLAAVGQIGLGVLFGAGMIATGLVAIGGVALGGVALGGVPVGNWLR